MTTPTAVPVQEAYNTDSLVAASHAAAGDLSAQSMLMKIFGTIADNPLAFLNGGQGQGDILGTIFMFINMGLLTLGSVYLPYKAVAAVTQTTHDGEFMGKTFHSVWVPIRITTGVAALVPIAGGWSMLQVLMLWIGVMGAGLGNMAWQGVVNSSWLPFQQAALRPSVTPTIDKSIAAELFKSHTCTTTHNLQAGSDGGWGSAQVRLNDGTSALQFGSVNGTNAECGRYSFTSISRDLGDYNLAQRAAVIDAANSEFLNLNSDMSKMAEPFARASASVINDPDHAGAPLPPAPDQFASIAVKYRARLSAAVTGALRESDALGKSAEAMRQRAQSDGFTTAGAFYWTIARESESVNSMIKNASPTLSATAQTPHEDESAWRIAFTILDAEAARQQTGASALPAKTGNEDAAWKMVMSEMDSNSIGQDIVNRITQDSESRPVLVRMKDLADYMVGAASAAITAAGSVKGAIAAAKESTGTVPVLGGLVSAGVAALSGPLSGWLDVIGYASQLALGFFLMASIFLPLIPFIVFMGQILNWLITVIEGVAAMPFLAFAHLDTDGEGLGHKTQYGYTFMLSSFMRPVMLVLGFVIACILLEVMGGYLLDIFPLVIAGAQSDSVTGFFSILGLVAIFFLIAAGLVNSCMSVMYLLPDAIFAFIGAHSSATATVGRDAATSMTAGALAGAQVGRQVTMRNAQPVAPKAKKDATNSIAKA